MDYNTKQEIGRIVESLHAKLAERDAKYRRSYNRFLSNGARNEGIRTIYTRPPSLFVAQTDADVGVLPAINVGRSMALTLQSKLIQTKGRIFFNPVNGLWNTIKTCRNAQIYFDGIIETQNITDKVKKCILNALVFELGVMFIDDETKNTEVINPWEFYVDPAELNYKKVKKCFIMQEWYPIIDIKDKLKPEHRAYQNLQNDITYKGTVIKYFDLVNKKRYLIIDNDFIEEKTIDYDTMPFALFYYNDPIKGLYSTSVMDNCYQNQMQIDDILIRMHDALTLSPANTIYIPKSASNDNLSKMFSNKVGNIVPYDSSVGQVIVHTPAPIDPSYKDFLQFFIQTSYEQEGISQLSAQSKKPTGINSGVALDTLQDVESERFQCQVDNLIQFYKDIYTTMINVFPENDDILPKRVNRANIKWKEIKKQRDTFSLSSSLASVLSKDPKVKMEQIEKLQQQGIINPYMAASLLQLPDLEGAYSSATASYDCSRKIIERALDEEIYDFYNVVNLKQLLEESVNILLQLDAVDEDPAILSRLLKLIDIVNGKINGVMDTQNPQMPQQPIPPTPMVPQLLDQLVKIAENVKSGMITQEAGRSIISVSFPEIPANIIDSIITGQPVIEEQAPPMEGEMPVEEPMMEEQPLM